MADLPSILGGLAQGFIDFGKGAVDLFGTGGAAIGDLIRGTGTKNQDDFRKWLYNTNDNKDAAAKGLGTALNGVQTTLDYIPGVNMLTRNPLGNAAQGALGGLADEFKTYGKDYDLGRAGQRAAVSAVGAAASGGLADALKGSANPILRSGALQGLARGATGGAITGGGYAAIDGGDVLQSALQGAGTGALIGGVTGAVQDFKPAKTYDVALTDDEKAARIAAIDKQLEELGPVSRFDNSPEAKAKQDRIIELMNAKARYSADKLYDTAGQEIPEALSDYFDDVSPLARDENGNLIRFYHGTPNGDFESPRGGSYFTPDKEYAEVYLNPNASSISYGKQATNPATYEAYLDLRKPFDLSDPEARRIYIDEYVKGGNATGINPYQDNYDDIKNIDWTEVEGLKEYLEGTGYGYDSIIADEGGVPDGNGGVIYRGKSYVPFNSDQVFTLKKNLAQTLSDSENAINNPKLTPEQEAYFKDSVIREPGGGLKTVYHGTDADFNTFGEIKTEPGYWFTEDKDYAASHGKNLKTVNLNMKNPLDLNTTEGDNKLVEYLRECFGENASESDIYTKKFRNFLKNKGYDGMIWEHSGKNTYIAFEPNQIKDVNNLAPTDDMDIMRSAILPDDADLADTLSKQDLAINNAKVAPGQLDLFSDYTPKPKTGPTIDGLDYYGDDIRVIEPEAPANPYAPVDGQVTQAMRDRASEIIDSLALKRQIPDNELFNRIDPATLPKGQQKIGEFLDQAYAKGLTHGDVTDMMRETVSAEFDKRLGKAPNKEKLISFIFGNADETAKKEMMDKELGLYIAPETVSEGTLNSMARRKISSEIYGDNLSALVAGNRTLRGGYTGALDSVLSERLGIAPGNTYKKTGEYDTGGSYGRYQEYMSNPNKNNIMVRTSLDNEDAVNTMAHERLHSFQTEAKKLYDQDRYSPEVKDAYDELAKDLKSAKAYRTGDEVKKRYGSGVAYWRHHDEQEARMLQQYLDAKGYTGSRHHNENKYLGLEFDDAKIIPAFDKFFDKLRDLSKRGVALPAIAALFGGGAYMASQNNDKEKEVK